MPLYDYRCAACGREVEVMHGIHESGPTACDACGGRMYKLLSPPTIHFKGSGWAKKDAAAASATKAKPKGSTGATGDKGSGDASTKSESKEKSTSGDKGGSVTSSTSAASD
jgi:putative FmdB family regulatory protein